MINITLLEFKWGLETGHTDEGQAVARLNMQCDDSKIVTTATFGGEALGKLAFGLVDAMSDEDKNMLLAKLTAETTGIIVPSGQFLPPANQG